MTHNQASLPLHLQDARRGYAIYGYVGLQRWTRPHDTLLQMLWLPKGQSLSCGVVSLSLC
jgi:hypothetical protein